MRRRDLLGAGLKAGALLTGVWPGCLAAQDNGKGQNGWSFIAVNDLHFREAACGPWLERVVRAMKQSAPEAAFCLLGGDLADEGKPEQLAGVRAAFATWDIPVYATPGNHDYAPNDDLTAYAQYFPGQVNQSFEHQGWQFIGLDSSDGTRYENIRIQPATFQWLETNLTRLDSTRPTVLWTHFPLGTGVTYRPLNADALLERLVNFNLQAVLSGHWHGFSERSWHNAVLTTNRCCARVRNNHDGSPQKGWFVCTPRNGKLMRRFVEFPLV